jgi:hypothetical protein
MEGTSQAVLGSSSQRKVLASLSILFYFFLFFFFYVGHSKFMEKLFWILFYFLKQMVKITQQNKKSESKTNTLWSPVKSYETLEFLRTPMLNSPSYNPLERCHPSTLHRTDGKAEKRQLKEKFKKQALHACVQALPWISTCSVGLLTSGTDLK